MGAEAGAGGRGRVHVCMDEPRAAGITRSEISIMDVEISQTLIKRRYHCMQPVAIAYMVLFVSTLCSAILWVD